MSNISHVYVDGKPVSALNPLPTTGVGGGGGGDVNVVSIGGATVSRTGGTQHVNVVNSPAVTVSSGSVNATVVNTPSVNATGSTVAVSSVAGTVTTAISGTPSVVVANTPAVTISGTPSVSVTNTLPLHPVNVTQLGSSTISQSAGVQNVNATIVSQPAPTGITDVNLTQLGGVAVSTQNVVAPSGIKGVFPMVVRDDTRSAVEANTRIGVLRTDAQGSLYVNSNLRYVNGFSIAATDGNLPCSIVNPTTNGTTDSVPTPNNALLAPLYAWNGVNQVFDRVRSVVSTFSAANSDFVTTVSRLQDRIVFGLTCEGNERIVKVYKIGVQVNMDNDSVMNPLSLRLYKGIDTGGGDPVPLDRVNHDNSFGGPFGNNLSPTARPIVYRSGAGGGGFIDGSVRAANTYVRRRFQTQMWDFGVPPRQPLILRGDRNGIVLVNNADFAEDYVLSVWVEWTEEIEGQAVP